MPTLGGANPVMMLFMIRQLAEGGAKLMSAGLVPEESIMFNPQMKTPLAAMVIEKGPARSITGVAPNPDGPPMIQRLFCHMVKPPGGKISIHPGATWISSFGNASATAAARFG